MSPSLLICGLGPCGLPSTLSLRLDDGESLTPRSIKAAVSARSRLPDHAFHITLDGRVLHEQEDERDDDEQHDSATQRLAAAAVECGTSSASPLLLRVVYRSGLLGGKGGFGSLLRTATTKVGAKKTDNFSASRDLSGRRMRHVEAERAIAEWNAQQHDPVDQRELAAKYKAIKEGRPVDVKPCKWGATCKYRYSTCRREHGEDPEAAAAAAARAPITSMAAVLPLSEVNAKELTVSSSYMEDSVSAGLQSSKKRLRGGARAAAADGESKEQASDEQSDNDPYAQDAYSSSSDDEDGPAAKRLHTDGASSSSAAAASAAASSISADAVPLSAVYAATYVAPTPAFPSITHRKPDLDAIDGKQAHMGLAAVMAKVKAKQHANSNGSSSNGDSPSAAGASSSSSAAAAAAASSSYDAIDLGSVSSAQELLRFDAAHLAHELTRVGLKAGGTHDQKAQRLFMLKGTTIDKLPKKVLAAA